jgi:hypothetical protein
VNSAVLSSAEYKLEQPLWRFLKKTRDRTATRSSDTAPGIHPKKDKTGYSRDTYTLMFITALFTTACLLLIEKVF